MYWFKGFKCHPELRIKNSQNLSFHRAMCANKPQLNKWCDEYRTWLDTMGIQYKPNCIWNTDECGVQDVSEQEEVIGVVNEPAFQLVSEEKGQMTTLTSVSASGLNTPPMIIFMGAKVQKEWCEAAPAGVYVRASLSGYINAKLFTEYSELFITFLHKKELLDEKN